MDQLLGPEATGLLQGNNKCPISSKGGFQTPKPSLTWIDRGREVRRRDRENTVLPKINSKGSLHCAKGRQDLPRPLGGTTAARLALLELRKA